MILSDGKIKANIACGNITILPFDKDSIQPNSYDLHLGDHYYVSAYADGLIDPYDEESVNRSFIDMGKGHKKFVIPSGSFVLGTTKENITLSDNIVGYITNKSSLARLGLCPHEMAGWVDSGFSGNITLEFTNKHPRSIVLTEGMPIAQIAFFQCDTCEMPYNKRQTAKYNNQEGTTTSRYYMNR